MFCLIHDIPEDDRLLRAEFLSIVAAIITRMDHFASTPVKHVFIPVRRTHTHIYIPDCRYWLILIILGPRVFIPGKHAGKDHPGILQRNPDSHL